MVPKIQSHPVQTRGPQQLALPELDGFKTPNRHRRAVSAGYTPIVEENSEDIMDDPLAQTMTIPRTRYDENAKREFRIKMIKNRVFNREEEEKRKHQEEEEFQKELAERRHAVQVLMHHGITRDVAQKASRRASMVRKDSA